MYKNLSVKGAQDMKHEGRSWHEKQGRRERTKDEKELYHEVHRTTRGGRRKGERT